MHNERTSRYGNDNGFEGSWDGIGVEADCILVDGQISRFGRYEYLGLLALRATGAMLVLCIGGGMMLALEHELMGVSNVHYLLFDVCRRRAGPTGDVITECSSLVGRVRPVRPTRVDHV